MQYNREGQSSTPNFFSYRDLDVVPEETAPKTLFNSSYLNKILNPGYPKETLNNNDNTLITTSYASALPLRRSRAGTMPSMTMAMVPPDKAFSDIIEMSVKAGKSGRNRSESLTLPAPPNGYSWKRTDTEPVSPSTEQFLQQGDDIAHTLRSIGLDSENDNEINVASSALPPSLLLPINKPISSRNRSQSVNNGGLYQLHQQQPPIFKSLNFSIDNENDSNQNNNTDVYMNTIQQPHTNNRPRSISVGRMDYIKNSKSLSSASIWKNNLDTLDDDVLYEADDIPKNEPPFSLGDSELLANMLQNSNKNISNGILNSELEVDNQNNLAISLNSISNGSKSHQTTQHAPYTSRSLWVGNIDSTLTTDMLKAFFSTYGPIESVRLLTEKECAFVNFYNIADAVNAKDDILSNLGGRIGLCIVRIGYGRLENSVTPVTTVIETPVVSHPTRALWLGNMPTGTTQASLNALFSRFGNIESIRVLSQKNCAFVNFEDLNSASFAYEALIKNEPIVKELWGIRVGFAKTPTVYQKLPNFPPKAIPKNDPIKDYSQVNHEIWTIMKELGSNDIDKELVTFLHTSSYFESIPSVSDYGYSQKQDTPRLKDIRKQIDVHIANDDTTESFDRIALDCMNEIAELCSDYIGNTIIQRLFEKCSNDSKTTMLKAIAPHLASIGVHKNGTWAAQKIIDSVNTVDQIQIVSVHIQPYIPPLLLDQYGNYVVQCCLKMKGDNQYVTNAIVDKLVNITQGRYGARAVRGILDGQLITESQQKMIATALIRNSALLSLQTNGSILITWLIDSSTLPNRLRLLSAQLALNLIQIATHKLGTQILLKLINQDTEPDARQNILKALGDINILSTILEDQSRGLPFVTKLMSSEFLTLDEKTTLGETAYPMLNKLQGSKYKKAMLEFVPKIRA